MSSSVVDAAQLGFSPGFARTMSGSVTTVDVDRAVDVFSDLHDRGRTPSTGWYRSRIPAVAPGAGEQYAFEVDLDACTGCKACVVACHSMNGLDEGELWRNVGLLESVRADAPDQRTVTTACHHCVDPACLNGCPVNAYDKDVLTGVVVHLDDQCIGCSYCTMMCPYEVPVFNERLGIVRKCDMCHGRLAAGEAPACVQGCPNAAIRITITRTDRDVSEQLVPGAPLSSLTRPTTQYLTASPGLLGGAANPVFRQADASVSVAHGHEPLVAMLLLIQLAAGVSIADRSGQLAWLSALLGFVAAGCSSLHLGRPQYAWRVVLGVKHSWLSREAIAVGLFVGSCLVHLWARGTWSWALSAVAALAVTFASTRVYSETRRALWLFSRTGGRFGAVVLYSALLVSSVTANPTTSSNSVVALSALFGVVAVADLTRPSRYRRTGLASLGRTAWLLTNDLRPWHLAQCGAATVATASSLLWALSGRSSAGSLTACAGLVSFVLQRVLFFRSVSPDRMPQ